MFAQLLTHPFSWDALKRALRSGRIRIESLEQMLSLVSTISLEPETIPLDLKVVLVGDRLLYYLLTEYDPEFSQLFKVNADFSESFERSPESTQAYARVIASLAGQEELRPIERQGVARIIEHSSRVVEDGGRISLHMGGLKDLLREADYWAGEAGHKIVTAADVQQAIEAHERFDAEWGRLTGRSYGAVEAYKAEDAELLLVTSPLESSADHRAAFAAVHRLLGGLRQGGELIAADLAVLGISELATPVGTTALAGAEMGRLRVIRDAALASRDGKIVFVGSETEFHKAVKLAEDALGDLDDETAGPFPWSGPPRETA